MKKFLLLFFFLSSTLFACATCQLMIPTAHLDLELEVQNSKLVEGEITWSFSDLYTQEIYKQYDKNKNLILDPNEMEIILQAKLDYLVPKKMLTQIKLTNNEDEEKIIDADYKNFSLFIKEEKLRFYYTFTLKDIEITDKTHLSFLFEDDENYFSFILNDVKLKAEDFYFTINNYLFTSSFYFRQTPITADEQPIKKEIKPEDIPQDRWVGEQLQEIQINFLEQSITKIKQLFEDAKSANAPFAFALLLFFAFIYGVVHAMGPGHGKTLVASYFLSNEKSYSKALFISLAIGVVHTFSAFLLTLVIYYFVQTFLAQFMDNTIYYTTKISALIIVSIALYLFYKKYRAYKNVKKEQKFSFSTTPHPSTCGCGTCKVDQNSTDAALIIAAGIIPCPGTITLFIFALSLEMYMLGFLSAFVMSLGMSSIIYLSALASVFIRNKSLTTNPKIKKYLEYISLSIILLLGLFLLF